MWVRVATFEGGDTEKLDQLMDRIASDVATLSAEVNRFKIS